MRALLQENPWKAAGRRRRRLFALLLLPALLLPGSASASQRCKNEEIPDLEREDFFHAGERMETEEGTPNIDANAYRCFEATGKRSAPFPVRLVDAFGRGDVKVLKPYLFCAPVSRNGEPIADLDTHLVCYEIRSDSKRHGRQKVEVMNHFGSTRLSLGGASLLCLPSGGHSVE